jgi:hypothetical protein
MSYSPSVTDTAIITALRAYLMAQVFPAGWQVIQDTGDRLAMPKPPYAVMSHVSKPRLATNVDSISTQTVGTVTTTTAQVLQSTKYGIQLDVVGKDANESSDVVQVLTTTWFSGMAADALRASGIAPLYNDDPRYAPWTNGENQWEHRWIVNLFLQANPALVFPSSSFAGVNVGVVDVESFPIE